jgi:hypothetical protein
MNMPNCLLRKQNSEISERQAWHVNWMPSQDKRVNVDPIAGSGQKGFELECKRLKKKALDTGVNVLRHKKAMYHLALCKESSLCTASDR